jgi:hypothetical protein
MDDIHLYMKRKTFSGFEPGKQFDISSSSMPDLLTQKMIGIIFIPWAIHIHVCVPWVVHMCDMMTMSKR